MKHAPGQVRDAIVAFLSAMSREVSVAEIYEGVRGQLGDIPPSSVRSYLNLNVPELLDRTSRGFYRLKGFAEEGTQPLAMGPSVAIGRAELHQEDCFEWLGRRNPSSIEAVVTDPPYGLIEYTPEEQEKLRNGRGGVWRIPPSFDGHKRSPLPRFTVMDDADRQSLHSFFKRFALLISRVVVPGANIIVASNPLLSHIVASAMVEGGLELRGTIVRLTMTMRGGDRPKNAHQEFSSVSVMPRSMFEPWVVLRRPLDGRVQDNLRRWRTGGFRRLSDEKPFGDVIVSRPTTVKERRIAPHPSLKPQEFLRRIVRSSLPLGEGTVLDPFAGSGSTLAAANQVGYPSIGIESDPHYVTVATKAIAKLASLD